jgi:hypothetical protein
MSPEVLLVTAGVELGHRHRRRIQRRAQLHPRGPRDGPARRHLAALADLMTDEDIDYVLQFQHDPLGFVQRIYPWGEPGRWPATPARAPGRPRTST